MEIREFRAEGVATDDSGKLRGLVTPFDRETTIGDMKRGGWKETVKPGFFTKTLREADYLLVYQHDLAKPMARKSAGNLEFREGELEGQRGLVMDADPVDTSYTQDCMKLVRAKVINGMSFGFNVVKDAWFDDKGNPSDRMNGTRRELLEGQLIEGSPVTRPAYGGTTISARDDSSALLEARQRAVGDGDPEERAPMPYGDVPYADPKNGKYPIDKSHVKAAWAYINQAKNAAKYPLNGVSLKSVKDRIRKAMQKFGFTSGTAAEMKFEFADPEWRDDDPYFDDWYEIDEPVDEPADDETKAQMEHPYPNLVAAILAHRSEPAVIEAIDYCISLREAEQARDEQTSGESREQEPETSTPNPEDESLALRMAMRSREIELEI